VRDRLFGHLVWIATASGALACVPEVDPPWLIRRPTELALHTEVVAQGPFGPRQSPEATRSFHDVLPQDTVRFEPFVVDVDGPIPLEELSARWVVCPANACFDALIRVDELPECDLDRPYTQIEACSAGAGPTMVYTLGGIPDVIDEATIFALLGGPNVGVIASRLDRPGADACVRGLAARGGLDGCTFMLRPMTMGPASALLDAAEELGLDIELSDSLEPILAVPRNRNPQVRRFQIEGSSQSGGATRVSSGDTVRVQVGDVITIRWLPEDDDFDDYEIDFAGETLVVEEIVTGAFFFDRPTETFEEGVYSVTLRVEGASGTANVYFVAADAGGSEAWGTLILDITAG
jgi:hypothetical protein